MPLAQFVYAFLNNLPGAYFAASNYDVCERCEQPYHRSGDNPCACVECAVCSEWCAPITVDVSGICSECQSNEVYCNERI